MSLLPFKWSKSVVSSLKADIKSTRLYMDALKVVILGAGPVGIIFAIKLIEELHKVQNTQPLDCKILLIEKRDDFKYADHRRGTTVIRLDIPTSDRHDGVWPHTLALPRFRNRHGEWKSFGEALFSGADYTVLRHDLLVALSQLTHSVFGRHDCLHFVPNTLIQWRDLDTIVNSCRACIVANGITNFDLDANTHFILCAGKDGRNSGHMFRDNRWNEIDSRTELKLTIGGTQSKSSRDPGLSTVGRQAYDFADISHLQTSAEIEGDSVAVSIDLSSSEATAIRALLGRRPSMEFRELPPPLARELLKVIAFQLFKIGATLSRSRDIGNLHVSLNEINWGFWDRAVNKDHRGLVMLLGSTFASHPGSFNDVTIIASLLAVITSYVQANHSSLSPDPLQLWNDYAILACRHALESSVPGIFRAAKFMETLFFPVLRNKLHNERESLVEQLRSLESQLGPYVLRVPHIENWKEKLRASVKATIEELYLDANTNMNCS